MFAEAADIDRDGIVEALRDLWSFSVSTIRYEPVGFGSHHYVTADATGTNLFLTVDDLRRKGWIAADRSDNFAALERAFAITRVLRSADLDFVHAPLPNRENSLLARIGDHYSLAVFEFLDARPGDFDEKLDRPRRRRLLGALGRLHASTEFVAPLNPRRNTLDIPHRSDLMRSLEELDVPWTGGPFSEIARGEVAAHVDGLRHRLDVYDGLAQTVAATTDSWVVTHGEPHPGNLMWTEDSLMLIDWDTVAIAPPERDLWMVDVGEDLDAYVTAGGTPQVSGEAIELHRLWWALAEVALYVGELRSPHSDEANTRESLAGLRQYLPPARNG